MYNTETCKQRQSTNMRSNFTVNNFRSLCVRIRVQRMQQHSVRCKPECNKPTTFFIVLNVTFNLINNVILNSMTVRMAMEIMMMFVIF